MKKKMILFAGILTFIVFVSFLLDIIWKNYGNFSQIKLKEVFYLIGWMLLSFYLLYNYFYNK